MRHWITINLQTVNIFIWAFTQIHTIRKFNKGNADIFQWNWINRLEKLSDYELLFLTVPLSSIVRSSKSDFSYFLNLVS